MCGIAGKIVVAGGSVTAADITRMTDAIAHRGPDDEGSYLSPDGTVGLGHRRLAVLDLTAAGHQPMSYRNRYWIVFGGEIYNFVSLRADLQRQGYTFSSQTDTEVILALYDRYQERCVEHLRGMFAFALFDTQKKILFCARDRVGKKPFKYYYDGRTFLFASELKAILTQPEYRREPDYLAIHHYLTLQYCPAPFTGFKNIKKLEPGHYLRLDLGKRRLEKRRYWRLNYARKLQLNEAEWQERIMTALTESVRLRLIADVPLGAFLSGGIDSSAIVGLMSGLTTKPVKTFSIGFNERPFSELPYAAAVAKHFRTDHTESIVKPETVDILPTLVAQYEEPYADSSALPSYYLSKLTRQHVTVALTGDGGDENFAGYSRYNIQKFALACDRFPLLPARVMQPAAHWLARHFKTTFSHRLQRFVDTLPSAYQRRYVNYICYFTNPMKERLYAPGFMAHLDHDTYDLIGEKFVEAATPDPLDQTLYADLTTYLPEDLLVKIDLASMAVGLEARSPFLDHTFLELTAQLPFNLKLKGWRGNKYILKQALASLLPAEILNRKKMGFMLPLETWFRGDLNSYLRGTLLSPQSFLTRELFQEEAIQELLKLHTTTAVNVAPPLWALLTLELWFQHYFS